MASDAVVLQVSECGVATLTLNRPQALNALNGAMADALRDAVTQIEHDDRVRAVLINGAGEHFMAGGDLRLFHGLLDLTPQDRRAQFERFIQNAHDPILRLHRLPKPVVAAVHGAVAGFGLSLMASCDLAIAADDAYFTLAYCNIGATPDGSSTYTLPRLVGTKRAMEIALLGDRFDARHALDIGLLNRVVTRPDLDSAAQELAARLARGPTRVLARTKQLLNDSLQRSLPEQLLAEQQNFAASAAEPDFVAGLQAFLDKRKPEFTG